MFDLAGPVGDPLADLDPVWSMWRYRRSLPEAQSGTTWEKTTLGEGMTPLVGLRPGLLAKLEQVSPTGSFKDRGAALIVSLAAGAGERVAVADSSGNAGKAVAAYAARAGMRAEIFVPAGTPAAKTSAAVASGATVIEVGGGREAAAGAAMRRVEAGGAWYASHVYQAAFVHGVKTLAFELFEQLGGRVPGSVVVPVGNGSLVQGLWLGFSEIARFHRTAMPELVACQSDRFALLAGCPPSGEPTAAAGIAIAKPPRLGQVRAALVASSGRVVAVGEDSVLEAQEALGGVGLPVEPTAAVAWAALERAGPLSEPVVVVLTGR
jgi:threonine synthase